MITEGQFYDLRSRVAVIEADNPTGKTFQPFDEGRGATFIPEASGGVADSVSVENITYNVANTSGIGHVYAFETFPNAAFTGVIMESGDIMVEPGDNGVSPSEWIEWSSITGYTTTPAVSSTDVCVWLSIDVDVLTAEMMVGTESAMKGYIAGLSEEVKKITTMRPLVKTEWQTVEGVTTIKRVKNLQCGDVIISRL
jgi:hypothetical protein